SALLASDQRTVFLGLATALSTGTYTLQVAAVQDIAGNLSASQSTDFQFIMSVTIEEFDLLINEIMADPTPSAGLPEVEWVEIYNRSGKTLNLGGLRFDDGGTPQTLPAQVLAPQSYIVLATVANAAVLKTVVPNVLGVPGFPSLNNDGDVLTLSTAAGLVIDRVPYTLDWHTETAKKDGGWTLERINPNIPCLGKENWQSAPNLPGGTPGQPNGSLQTSPDLTAPGLLAAFPESATSIRLSFSEGLDQMTAENAGAYSLSPARTISAATLLPGDRTTVILSLDEPLQNGVVYTLEVTQMVEDCSGNTVEANTSVMIGLPEQPEFQDIVVNEILFNPATGGSDYVEFYNRSQKIFNWSEFLLSNVTNGVSLEVITANRLFLPGDYAVFTTNPGDILDRFDNVREAVLYKNNLPSLPDDAGSLILFWRKPATSIVTVDALNYKADWHNALLSTGDREGVALERISADLPTNSATNWTSAARPSNGKAAGTPTQPNSQRFININPTDDLVYLPVDRLSPDNDGFEDFLDIRYALPESGYSATLTIFDSDGVPTKRLVRQQLLGSAGQLRWDGDTEDGNRARPGIYILYLELFSPAGDIEHVKRTFAVVSRF
ncbi:MAG: lamin tail domain-containing protein, partial [Saprospiraceae bacterium]